jgi:nicotinamide mononucleotide (NMN) deamidase PncC
MSYPSESMQPLLQSIAKLLVETSSTLSVAESTSGMFQGKGMKLNMLAHPLPSFMSGALSIGGLISAALLSLDGASAWYKGGTVLYTLEARSEFCGWTEEDTKEYR